MSTQASVTRRRPDCTRNSTSRRLNSCLLIDNTATAHLPGPQNPGVCHLYLAEGCHLYIALTAFCRIFGFLENRYAVLGGGRWITSGASEAEGPSVVRSCCDSVAAGLLEKKSDRTSSA